MTQNFSPARANELHLIGSVLDSQRDILFTDNLEGAFRSSSLLARMQDSKSDEVSKVKVRDPCISELLWRVAETQGNKYFRR